MALLLDKKDWQGVTVTYHRVSRVVIEPNAPSGIWVASYISRAEREIEMDDDNADAVYHSETYFTVDDDSDSVTSIADAYVWLKGRPEFADAEDC